MTTVEVPLSQGYVAVIDAADADLVLAHKWHAQIAKQTVYARRNVVREDGSRTTLALHKFLTGLPFTDHMNGNGLDNRRANLRAATAGENNRNRRRSSNTTCEFKGVYWHKDTSKWVAQIRADDVHQYLGCYVTADEAARAYDAAARELHGEYATVNFPAPGERAA